MWQRGKGEGCEVYVKFKDTVSVQRFLTLNYVRYRARPITVSSVKEEGGLAEYLAGPEHTEMASIWFPGFAKVAVNDF